MRAVKKFSLLALCLLCCLAIVSEAAGQAVYGSIFGTVTDQNGSAVPNATVTITNLGTNVVVTAKTNESGNYNQTRLIPGTYRIKVEAANFKAAVVDTLIVNVDRASES